MKKHDPLWQDINTLLSYLRTGRLNAVYLVDRPFLKYGNSAPGELLRRQIDKLQKRLDEAEGMKIFDLAKEWMEDVQYQNGPRNIWLVTPEIQAYVRRQKWMLDGESCLCFTIANVEVRDQGCGTFTAFLDWVHNNHIWQAVVIENVLAGRFQNYFHRRGFTKIAGPGGGPPSFYLKKGDVLKPVE